MASDTDAMDLGHLDPAIQKVEFKLTVLTGEEGKVQAWLQMEAGQPRRRKVYFYDTRDLALCGKHLVLRARVTQGDDDDSAVKLRPVDLADDEPAGGGSTEPGSSSTSPGDKQVPSVKLDGEPDHGEIEEVEANQRPVGSLFSGKQERLIADYAPDGISLHLLEVLGPVDARKWDLDNPDGFPHTLSVEEWSLPDTTRFIELVQSFRRRSERRANGLPVPTHRPRDRRRGRSDAEDAARAQVLRRSARRLGIAAPCHGMRYCLAWAGIAPGV
jgi:hypothetical protein